MSRRRIYFVFKKIVWSSFHLGVVGVTWRLSDVLRRRFFFFPQMRCFEKLCKKKKKKTEKETFAHPWEQSNHGDDEAVMCSGSSVDTKAPNEPLHED